MQVSSDSEGSQGQEKPEGGVADPGCGERRRGGNRSKGGCVGRGGGRPSCSAEFALDVVAVDTPVTVIVQPVVTRLGVAGMHSGVPVNAVPCTDQPGVLVHVPFGLREVSVTVVVQAVTDLRGAEIDRGVLVDEYLNAGFPGIYAAGDCAQIYHPEIGDYWISIGHDNACCLGRIAATNLAGGALKTYVKPESIFAVNGININSSWWTEI